MINSVADQNRNPRTFGDEKLYSMVPKCTGMYYQPTQMHGLEEFLLIWSLN